MMDSGSVRDRGNEYIMDIIGDYTHTGSIKNRDYLYLSQTGLHYPKECP